MSELVIDVEPELHRRICDRAEREGIAVSELVRPALEQIASTPPANPIPSRETTGDAQGHAGTAASGRRPIWEIGAALMQNVPEEELRRLPTDLSENLDHYLYGAPKRQP